MNSFLPIFCLLVFLNTNGFTRDFAFAENKGQWEQQIKYKAPNPLGVAFITNNGMMMHLADMEKVHDMLHDGADTANAVIDHHAYAITFVNAQTNTKFTAHKPSSSYDNYFIGGDKSKWQSEVRSYEYVQQQNIYSNIDVQYVSRANGFKYEFIVRPNGNPADVQLKIDGITPIINEQGELEYTTKFGKIIEQAPYCYQVINGDTITVASKFKLTD